MNVSISSSDGIIQGPTFDIEDLGCKILVEMEIVVYSAREYFIVALEIQAVKLFGDAGNLIGE